METGGHRDWPGLCPWDSQWDGRREGGWGENRFVLHRGLARNHLDPDGLRFRVHRRATELDQKSL